MASVKFAIVDVADFLSKKQSSDKELASEWSELEELYNKKLWHQVTLKLENFIKHESLLKGQNLVELYNNFISTIENKINPVALVNLVSGVSQQYADKKQAVAFLNSLENKVKGSEEALSLLKVLQGEIQLEQLNDLEETKKVIEDVDAILEGMDGVTPTHGRYYRLAAHYYRLKGDHSQYYKTALRYLGCVPLDQLTNEEAKQTAFFLALAALLGEEIYNMGELACHPALETLENTPQAWAATAVKAFTEGDRATFNKLRPQWSQVSDLVAAENKLQSKLRILKLVNMAASVAEHPPRSLTFQEIANETGITIDEVESVVTRALARGLIFGRMDGVSQTVRVERVCAAALDRRAVKRLAARVDAWCSRVHRAANSVSHSAHDILMPSH